MFRRFNNHQWLLVIFALLTCHVQAGMVRIDNPVDHIVFQRNNSNYAPVQIKGEYLATPVLISSDLPSTGGGTVGDPGPAAGQTRLTQLQKVEVRFTPVQPSWGTLVDWTNVPVSGLHFSGLINVTGGWYTMDLRVYSGGQIISSSTVSRVGVGEVFGITGHSNAQGGASPSIGCDDERVVSINYAVKWGIYQTQSNYCNAYASMSTGTNAIAPYAALPWTWGPMGTNLVRMYNVPVLFYSAAFGGTMSWHFSMSANGEAFDHSFVNWKWRMPYTNLYTIVHDFAPRTGIRAILALHGENDNGDPYNPGQESTASQIKSWYTNYFLHARADGNMPNLAFVLAHSVGDNLPHTWSGIATNKHYIAQTNTMALIPYVFDGPQLWQIYDTTTPGSPYCTNFIDKGDGTFDIHYSPMGQQNMGKAWADSITPQFFSNSVPYLATFH